MLGPMLVNMRQTGAGDGRSLAERGVSERAMRRACVTWPTKPVPIGPRARGVYPGASEPHVHRSSRLRRGTMRVRWCICQAVRSRMYPSDSRALRERGGVIKSQREHRLGARYDDHTRERMWRRDRVINSE